jgi:hypothetical protein
MKKEQIWHSVGAPTQASLLRHTHELYLRASIGEFSLVWQFFSPDNDQVLGKLKYNQQGIKCIIN